jgi:phage tail sheath protein FI
MPASFLHGVEVIELATGPAPITVVKSSVIGLVGTAPSWALAPGQSAPGLSAPTLVSSAQDAAKFRSSGPGLYNPVRPERDP